MKCLFPFALAGLLTIGGCRKTPPQANSTASTNTNQPATTPAPPPDQNGAATAAPGSTPTPTQNGEPTATPAPVGPSNAQQAQAPPPPLVVPAGTHIAVRLQQDLGSAISQDGESFGATVVNPITVDGRTAIPAGAQALGVVVAAHKLGRFKGGAYLELRLETVRAHGRTYQIQSSALERVEKGKGKRSAGFIGGGAGLGALIGGLAGGGKGALIGGLAGAGAGTAGAGLTGKKNIYLPAETTLTFRLRNPVSINR